MYCEINISLNGSHFFATAPRSIMDGEKLETVFSVLLEKFPSSEGYTITATLYTTTGKPIFP